MRTTHPSKMCCKKYLIRIGALLMVPVYIFAGWHLINSPGNGVMRKALINQNNEIISQGLNTFTFYAGEPFAAWVQTMTNDGQAIRNITASGDTLYGLNYVSSTGEGSFYLSTDWGQKWEFLTSAIITPRYDEVKLFKAFGDTLVIASKDTLFYSPDQGHTWIKWMEGIDTYFSAKDFIRTGTHVYVLSGTVHRADGFGSPFTELKTGLEKQQLYRLQQDKGRIYCLTYNSVFYLTDADNAWTKVTMGDFPYHAAECFYVHNDHIYALVYKEQNGFYHAKNGDQNWEILDVGLPKYNLRHITGNDNYLLVSADAGMFISGDRGQTWRCALDGLPAVDREIIDVKKTESGLYLMNLDGIYSTSDGGNSWEYFGGGLTMKARSVLSVNDTLFAIGSTGSGNFDSNVLFRKVHPDSNWKIPVDQIGGWSEKLFSITYFDNCLYLAGSNGVFVSHDLGNSWSDLNQGMTTYAYYLTVFRDNLYFFGKRNNGYNGLHHFNKSENAWEYIEDELHVNYANNLLQLAATDEYLFALTQKSLYRFNASLQTWDSLQVGYDENDELTTLLCNASTLLLGTTAGGYLSEDAGTTWESVSTDGISQNNPSLYFYDAAQDTVFIRAFEKYGTNNIYWNTIEGMVTAIPTKPAGLETYILYNNYPNPFNPNTVISYRVPITGRIHLTVYNALGQKVRTLVNAVQQAGNYSVTFNAAGMPSGVYFYQLQSENGFRQTRKCILMK